MAKRIVIADDAPFMRRLLVDAVGGAGYEVVAEAGDGAQAHSAFLMHRPDVVTMDIVMPEVDGLEGLRRILAEDPAARVVMVSAVDQRPVVEEALRAGAKGFLVKPFRTADVARALAEAMES